MFYLFLVTMFYTGIVLTVCYLIAITCEKASRLASSRGKVASFNRRVRQRMRWGFSESAAIKSVESSDKAMKCYINRPK